MSEKIKNYINDNKSKINEAKEQYAYVGVRVQDAEYKMLIGKKYPINRISGKMERCASQNCLVSALLM